VDREIKEKLLSISASSIDRILKEEKKVWEIKKKRKGYTRPGTLVKHQIPIRTFSEWDEKIPGFVEMDLVDHSGGVERGIFAQTLDMTDVCTGWTETIAIENKSQHYVFIGIDKLRKSFPFPLLEPIQFLLQDKLYNVATEKPFYYRKKVFKNEPSYKWKN